MDGQRNHHHHHEGHDAHFHAWMWVLIALIALAAFGMGFMCGKFSAFFGDYGYGYQAMGPWMMNGYYRADAPAKPAATATAPYYYPMWGMMGGYDYPQATGTR